VTVAVVAEGLVKRFGRTEALRGVDFEVERAQVLGLLGPNGESWIVPRSACW
jgi:ABC-type multidrug transport system ATPase subunit